MEIWDAYDKEGNLLNFDLVRDEPIADGVYHLVVEALIKHTDGDYLLMQRCARKKVYGGYYESSAGGSALKGEDSITAIKREVFEETGIDKFLSIKLINENVYDHLNSIFHTYIIETDFNKDDIKLQLYETMSFTWLSEYEYLIYVRGNRNLKYQIERLKPYIDTII